MSKSKKKTMKSSLSSAVIKLPFSEKDLKRPPQLKKNRRKKPQQMKR
jgi:hypothetical protein